MNKSGPYVVLIKYMDGGKPTWHVEEGPFNDEEVARRAAKRLTEKETETFAVAQILDIGYRRSSPTVDEVVP